jgi:L-lactate oxidase
MATSRRNLIQTIAAGSAALAAASDVNGALAQEKQQPSKQPSKPAAPPPGFGEPSSQERELKVVNVERLEDEARKILSPGRFAIMGPCGDGWTYRENRRAFNDHPIMPRRLQRVDDKDIDLSTTLLGHKLPLPVFTCPAGRAISTSKPNCPTRPAPAWPARCSSRPARRTSRWRRSPRRRRGPSGFRFI